MEKTHTIVIIPPEEVVKELSDLMWTLNCRYNASKAAIYTPHITLKSFGKISDGAFTEVMAELADVTVGITSFPLYMKGLRFYGSNENFPGIYIPVLRSPTLFELHKKLVELLGTYSDSKDRSYKEMENWNPHLTLVGNDISSEYLEMAKGDLRNTSYSYNFIANQIVLYRHTEEYVKPAHHWYIEFMLL